jgi:hypothetical protein
MQCYKEIFEYPRSVTCSTITATRYSFGQRDGGAMTADIANIDVREIDTGTVPTRFARGWHCLGVAKSYRDGRPHSVQAFGTSASNPGWFNRRARSGIGLSAAATRYWQPPTGERLVRMVVCWPRSSARLRVPTGLFRSVTVTKRTRLLPASIASSRAFEKRLEWWLLGNAAVRETNWSAAAARQIGNILVSGAGRCSRT